MYPGLHGSALHLSMTGKRGTSIDDKSGSRHIAGSRAAEEDHRIRHLLRSSNPAQRHHLVDPAVNVHATIPRTLDHGGLHPRGTDTIDPDSVGCVVQS